GGGKEVGAVEVGGDFAGKLIAGANLGPVQINGDVHDGQIGSVVNTGTVRIAKNYNGTLIAGKDLAAVHVGGDFAGTLFAVANLGTVQINGDVHDDQVVSVVSTATVRLATVFHVTLG